MKVIWTELALQDLEDIWIYISKDSQMSARKTIRKIRNATQQLIKHPETGRPGRVTGTRELVISGTPYLLPYRLRDGVLEILSVLHGSQEYPRSPK